MTSATKQERLHSHIDFADGEKLELLCSIFKIGFVDNSDLWSNPVFLAEMKNRIAEFESGAEPKIDWSEIRDEVRLLSSLQKAKLQATLDDADSDIYLSEEQIQIVLSRQQAYNEGKMDAYSLEE